MPETRERVALANTFQLGLLSDELQSLLAFYLKTTEVADREGGSMPAFWLPRSEQVDELLCRLALDAVYVLDQLYAALREVQQQQSCGGEGPWVLDAAALVHRQPDLQARARGYLRILAKHRGVDDPSSEVRPRKRPSFRIAARGRVTTDEAPLPAASADPPGDPPGALGQLIDKMAHLKQQVDITPTRTGPAHTGPARTKPELPGIHDCYYFEQRLAEEVARASRRGDLFSVVLFDVVEPASPGPARGARRHQILEQLGGHIKAGLREYDVCSRTKGEELLLLLPGATRSDCRSVAARLRRQLGAASPRAPRVCAGVASWPEDGSSTRELLERATTALACDRQPARPGEEDQDDLPAASPQPATVLFEGFPQEVKVHATETTKGVRIKMPLKFLQRGTAVQLSSDLASHQGTLEDTVLGRSGPTNTVPMLYLNVATGPGGHGRPQVD